MTKNSSISEDRGIEILNDSDLLVYSIGVSTDGFAEIRMALKNPKLRVIATTIDQKGVVSAEKNIEKNGLTDRVEIKSEDVTKPLPYNDGVFDYAYARLVLHYLSEKELIAALSEIYRTLKVGGNIFIVVRSTECHQATQADAAYDPKSHMTSYTETNGLGDSFRIARYFHTEKSIRGYVEQAGFTIESVEKYDERLYKDFMRTKPSPYVDKLIGVLAHK